MLLFVIQFLGRLTAATPEPVLRVAAAVLGDAIFAGMRARRRLILANLHHAFPERPARWHRRIGRASCRRMVETALLSLATPYLAERRIRRMATLGASVTAMSRDLAERPHPVVFGTAHLALWEAQTWLRWLSPVPLPEFGIIFRPLDNRAANEFVTSTREKFGMRMLSRKEGFVEALALLRANACVGVLFDQNAGMQGALTLCFDRVCSTTELPGLLAVKFGAEVRTFYPRRTGFWRVTFESDPVAHDGTTEGVTLALNRWLEDALRHDEALCASWLWAHDRWRNQDMPSRRFRLEAKRNFLGAELRARGTATLPRRTRIWVRLPNWLGDVMMALPLLRALRASRPDAEITLVAKPQVLALLRAWELADAYHPLPPRGIRSWWHFFRLRRAYIDVWVLFTNSLRGDLEAWVAGARQRFGLVRPGKPRPLLSHRYEVPRSFDERTHHQLELWTDFFHHFGLPGGPDTRPVAAARDTAGDATSNLSASPDATKQAPKFGAGAIGLIPGSENNPEKRWPVVRWRELIAALPDERFVVFGTANDLPIANAVATGFGHRVENAAGKTDLLAFAERLSTCRLLITNDTGGMHLANALGVPLIAVFGPTNPVRTGPVFSAPTRIIQPPNCPPTGGGALLDLEANIVVTAIAEISR